MHKNLLILEAVENKNMSYFLLEEAPAVEAKQAAAIIKSMNNLSKAFTASGFDNTAKLLSNAVFKLSKLVGRLDSKDKEAIKAFKVSYAAIMNFFGSLKSMLNGIENAIKAAEPNDNELLNKVLKGGVTGHAKAFIPRGSGFINRMKDIYSNLEELGSQNESFMEHGSVINDAGLEEGIGDAFMGVVNKLLGKTGIPKDSKTNSKNLSPLFDGDILVALQKDMGEMTVGNFRKLSSSPASPDETARNALKITSPVRPTEETTEQQPSVPTEEAITALTEPANLDAVLDTLGNDPKMKAIVAAIKKLADDPSLISKLDKDNPQTQVVTSLANAAQEAEQKGTELNPETITTAVEQKESAPVEGEQSTQGDKISLKKILGYNFAPEKSRNKLLSALKDGSAIQLKDVIPDLDDEQDKKLKDAITKLISTQVVETKTKKKNGDDLIVERWSRLAGLKD